VGDDLLYDTAARAGGVLVRASLPALVAARIVGGMVVGRLAEPARLSAIAGWGGYALATGMMAALPLGVGLLLVNLAIGVTARSAPQLNLFSVGFPLLLLMGLVGLPLALPALSDTLSGGLAAMQGRLTELLLG
ncbi:MAG: flagellar biosynthetic protein FliR, partial [Sandaracinobacter sp.]